MATTTNYGWTTPDDTALVKDGAAAIRTLGSSVDTTTKALNPSTTLGDIEYRSSTANTNTRLGIGTTGQVLTVAGGVPSWATAAGGGKVLQVVEGTTTTQATNNTSTYQDTGLTATITPSSATSKILVFVNQNGCVKNNLDANSQIQLKLMRTSTTIADTYALYTATALTQEGCVSLSKLDSPSTTSATTYKTQFNNPQNTSGVKVQNNDGRSTIILMEIGA
jgi:hypothetical protein